MKTISIAKLGSGFVADFYMQGLGNGNGRQVVLNDSRSAARYTPLVKVADSVAEVGWLEAARDHSAASLEKP